MTRPKIDRAPRRGFARGWLLLAGVGLLCSASSATWQDGQGTRLDETRLTMDKWLETEQILSRERREWQQAREILLGRLELMRTEVASLEKSLAEARASREEAEQKKTELLAERAALELATTRLGEVAGGMEREVKQLLTVMPDPVKLRLEPLTSRLPDEAAPKKVSAAERYQNVLGILNEMNKANNEINVVYEVHTLADGRPAEVEAVYVGLAQAYFLSAGGVAGIGRPLESGWSWEIAPGAAEDIRTALDILQGKHSPKFVPLPVKLQ